MGIHSRGEIDVPPDVTVVIVHYETPHLLEHCLSALLASDGDAAMQIVVVDNNSTEFHHLALSSAFPQVAFIRNQANVGFAVASNQGLRVARGRYFLLLNPDTVVSPDTMTTMLAFMDQDARIGCATPRLLLADGKLDPACRRSFPTPLRALFRLTLLSRVFPRSRLFGQYNLSYLDTDAPAEIDAPCGAFMMVRRDVANRVGLLDERYFMYGEDLDWAIRIKRAGWRIVYTPSTSVLHLKRASSRLSRAQAIRHFHGAMRIFYRQHYEDRYAQPVAWLVYAAISGRQFIELTAERLRSLGRRPVASAQLAPESTR